MAGQGMSGTLAANLSGGPHVFIGGTEGFDEIGTGSLAASLTAGGVGIYLHANAVQVAYDADELPAIAAAYAGAGPGEAELGFQSGANLSSFFGAWVPRVLNGQGLAPDEANIVLPIDPAGDAAALDAGQLSSWDAYVDAGRAAGVLNLAPIVSPNAGNEDISSWNAPFWQSAQQAATYGGGITVDAPPAYFLARGSDYRAFTAQEIAWGNAQGLRTTAIISPYGDDGSLLADTQAMVADLSAAGALPSQWVVEDYNDSSGTAEVAELAQVALWLTANTPGATATQALPVTPASRVAAAARSAAAAAATVATVPPGSVAAPAASASGTTQAGSGGWLVTAAGGSSTVTLGAAAETVSSQGADVILGGAGPAVVYASGATASVLGGAGGLLFVGGSGAVTVQGGSGSATLFGGSGGGTLQAGSGGQSILVAGAGNTTLQGVAGGDVLFGSAADGGMLRAGAGDEILVGGAGRTTLAGGTGTSVQFAGSGTDWFAEGGGGTDEVVGFKPDDHLAIPAGQSVSATRHGAWGTTLLLTDGTTVVLFGLADAPAA